MRRVDSSDSFPGSRRYAPRDSVQNLEDTECGDGELSGSAAFDQIRHRSGHSVPGRGHEHTRSLAADLHGHAQGALPDIGVDLIHLVKLETLDMRPAVTLVRAGGENGDMGTVSIDRSPRSLRKRTVSPTPSVSWIAASRIAFIRVGVAEVVLMKLGRGGKSRHGGLRRPWPSCKAHEVTCWYGFAA